MGTESNYDTASTTEDSEKDDSLSPEDSATEEPIEENSISNETTSSDIGGDLRRSQRE